MIDYIPKLKLYIGSQYIITEEEMEAAELIEKNWRDSQPKYSEKELFEIFPEGKKAMKNSLKEKIELLKKQISERHSINMKLNTMIAEADMKDRELLEMAADVFWGDHFRQLEKELKAASFKLAYLNEKIDNNKKSSYYSESQIAQAKAFKIESIFPNPLRQVGGRLQGRCPFHQDKTPSFTIYPHTNSFYCFSCNRGGSIITYIQMTKEYSFREAVKFLLGG